MAKIYAFDSRGARSCHGRAYPNQLVCLILWIRMLPYRKILICNEKHALIKINAAPHTRHIDTGADAPPGSSCGVVALSGPCGIRVAEAGPCITAGQQHIHRIIYSAAGPSLRYAVCSQAGAGIVKCGLLVPAAPFPLNFSMPRAVGALTRCIVVSLA